MTLATYEPPSLEIKITLTLGMSVSSPYYRGFVKSLNLRGGQLDCVDVFFPHEVPARERPGVVNALGRRLKPGGRLILREPQGEGVTLEEMNRLATASGLLPLSLKVRKIAIGAVYGACFIR